MGGQLVVNAVQRLLVTRLKSRSSSLTTRFSTLGVDPMHGREQQLDKAIGDLPLDRAPEQLLWTAHQQAAAEACFRQLHDPLHVAWQPMYHRTDQKIRVHGLYCLIALLLVQLLRLLARRAGDTCSVDRILKTSTKVQECLIVPVLQQPDQRPHLEQNLHVTNPTQRKLLTLTGASPVTVG